MVNRSKARYLTDNMVTLFENPTLDDRSIVPVADSVGKECSADTGDNCLSPFLVVY